MPGLPGAGGRGVRVLQPGHVDGSPHVPVRGGASIDSNGFFVGDYSSIL